jgi:hypothetical protein
MGTGGSGQVLDENWVSIGLSPRMGEQWYEELQSFGGVNSPVVESRSAIGEVLICKLRSSEKFGDDLT